LPNPRADYDDYVHGFKLTDKEFETIRSLGEASRQFLVKQGHRSGVVQLELGALGDLLDILSTSLDNVELLDGIRAEVGDDPEVWMPIFKERLLARRSQR
jgi:type IV secretion system protein VirB4